MPTDPPYVPNEACIVCSHVFDRRLPALVAARGSAKDRNPELPESEYDGSWQVTCGAHDHTKEAWGEGPGSAKVIQLSEVKMLEPSLEPFLSIPPGFKVSRKSVAAPWIVTEIAD